ncbi:MULTISPECIES: GTP-binding protein [unclassified Actinomyces]|uniref:GTP-binding protein n=2 Tax=Actinomyces TaxID=1654 RepID=UPI0024B5AA6E|nr:MULTISPECIES: GTP-binding protein [unclassified Actinomyces]
MPRHALVLVSTVEPLLRDLAALTLGPEAPALIQVDVLACATACDDPADNGAPAVRLQGEAGVLDVPMERECWTCSVRETLLSVAAERADGDGWSGGADDAGGSDDDGREDTAAAVPEGTTVILLPPGLELVHLVPALATALAEHVPGARLAGVVHVIDASTAASTLLEHHPLSEVLAHLAPGDERCSGEVHMNALGYADLVLRLGEDPVGSDLIEHLRPHDTLLLPGLDSPVLAEALAVDHDAQAALARVHPATTRAWGGPDDHGVRTLDLSSDLPFHPGRLRELVGDLAGRGLLARGCFWVPTRPGRVCAWEVAGGVVSVGDAGTWGQAGDGTARSHLVVTGLADDAECEAVSRAFSRILLRSDELVEALAWPRYPDGLEDWLGVAEA